MHTRQSPAKAGDCGYAGTLCAMKKKEINKMNKLAFKAKMYQKKKPNIWDDRNKINRIILFCMLIVLGLMFLDDDKFNNRITGGIILILLFFRIVLMVGKFGIDKKSDNEGGFLEIFDNKILFEGEEIKIENITTLNLEINSHYEKTEYRSPNDMRPFYSQGFDNFLNFSTKNNKNYNLRFQLENKKHKNKLIPFSFHLIRNKIITPEMGVKFLNLTKSQEKENYFKNLEKYCK